MRIIICTKDILFECGCKNNNKFSILDLEGKEFEF